ncbi:MAG: hypothetical protein AAB011_01805, partial [Candidatus Eisenbacteria bacterium]
MERGATKSDPKRVEIDMNELEEIFQRASRGPLPPEDLAKLRSAMQTLGWLQGEISRQDASLGRLRKLLFGTPTTEKTSQVLGESPKKAAEEGAESEEPPDAASPPAPGHGRNGADAYDGAHRVPVPHPTLHPGDPCPE